MAFESYGFNDDKTKYDLSEIEELKNRLENIEISFKKAIYPVGAVYFSVNRTNPAVALGMDGTTWQEISTSQRFLAITPTSTNLSNGGTNTFKLAANQLPDHAHRIDTTTDMQTVDPFKRVRIVPMGTGGSTGDMPYNLGFKLAFRRGFGQTVTMLKHATNDHVTLYDKDTTEAAFNNSFALETTAGQTAQAQNPQVAEMNITANAKITGFTGVGIYDDAAYNSTEVSGSSVTYHDLTQQNIDNRPAYTTVYAWKRIS